MFPFDEDITDEIEDEKDPAEYEIDFTTGQLTGRIVHGLDAVKVWAWLALCTNRYTYEQYSFDYGHDLSDLIGTVHSQEYLESEVERIVKDTLMVNENIIDATVTDFNLDNEKLTVNVTISTKWGEIDLDV